MSQRDDARISIESDGFKMMLRPGAFIADAVQDISIHSGQLIEVTQLRDAGRVPWDQPIAWVKCWADDADTTIGALMRLGIAQNAATRMYNLARDYGRAAS